MKIRMTIAAIAMGAACITASQAGQGAGNAHGAATAGMTYHGDPVSGPTSPLPPKSNTPYSTHGAAGRVAPDPAASSAAATSKDQ
ncbi:hypothetical protein [Burkholderia gladioli]|uniref:Lipoprotein n=1 Tax=Burkholderia gladioli TaxID=28095 RepID=A0AB38TY46_BURGA|nr:hypothetical protein [Burkholderia gladioli]MBU9274113.1 hypothetical protein [Burkholderia gladioli]PRE20076.1 hypothetical protein C6P72_18610 [Burkholderia gladioli]PRH30298.1 hypothetical protein C6V07_30835 [Burkholderia gladioli]UWX72744.1 hypothetical protein NYZ96_30480 [Burkholderia gladioli]